MELRNVQKTVTETKWWENPRKILADFSSVSCIFDEFQDEDDQGADSSHEEEENSHHSLCRPVVLEEERASISEADQRGSKEDEKKPQSSKAFIRLHKAGNVEGQTHQHTKNHRDDQFQEINNVVGTPVGEKTHSRHQLLMFYAHGFLLHYVHNHACGDEGKGYREYEACNEPVCCSSNAPLLLGQLEGVVVAFYCDVSTSG